MIKVEIPRTMAEFALEWENNGTATWLRQEGRGFRYAPTEPRR